MNKTGLLLISIALLLLLVVVICIAGCTTQTEKPPDVIMSGTVANVQIFNIVNYGPSNNALEICRITFADGSYFTERGPHAKTISTIVYADQPFSLYIKNGHIIKIVEGGNAPSPAVYYF
ncbi:MAG: hypothetical protein WC470_00965 [Candidatus Paceibacterota bacterium]